MLTISDSTASWINEFSGSGNYNDIARYTGKTSKAGFGFGVYHNSRERRGFSTNLGFEMNTTHYYGNLIPYGNYWMSWYSAMDASLTAFSIPFTLRYHIGNRFRVFPEVGVFADINAKATGKGKTYSYSGTPPNMTILETDFYGSVAMKRINYGLTAGLGFLIPVGKNNILLKAEYRYGQLELTPDNFSRVGVYNRYYKFSAGYAIGMRKVNKSTNRLKLRPELRLSVNYSPSYRRYETTNSRIDIQDPLLGYGLSLYHGSVEKKSFQYLIGFDADLIRANRLWEYTQPYQNYMISVSSTNKMQTLNLSLNNVVRYYICQQKIRPFIQVGLAPIIQVLHNSKYHATTTNSINADVSEYKSSNTIVKLLDFSMAPNAGVGIILNASRYDYIMVLDWRYLDQSVYFGWDGESNIFKLSLGVRLHGTK